MEVKKVLVVAYEFPPVGGAGVQRPLKFVKYLDQIGWTPIVLTVSNPSVPVFDKGMEIDFPVGLTIYKAPTLEPSYDAKQGFAHGNRFFSPVKKLLKKIIQNILLPDLKILWWPGLIREILQIIKKNEPNCIFVTAPPFSSFPPIVLIARLKKIPVILDYRDEWSFARENLENSVKTRLAFCVDKFLEEYSVKGCQRIVTANNSYILSISERFSKVGVEKFTCITNGYDPDDFKGAPPSKDGREVISIVYAGTVWRATSLSLIIKAINESVRQLPEVRLTIDLYGRIVDSEMKLIRDFDQGSLVRVHGYIAHEILIERIRSADILLLSLSRLSGSNKIICGKVFEYMATRNHIFAVVPEGETMDILVKNYDNFSACDPDNYTDIYEKFLDILNNIAELRSKEGVSTDQFERLNLTRELASVFDRAVFKD